MVLNALPWKRTEKKWSSHHGQQKSLKCITWMQSQNDRMISVCFLQTLEMVILNTYTWYSDHCLFFIIEYVMKLIIRIWSL